MADDKKHILDPITCICKLALLHLLPDKTKLAIRHHVLHIHGHSCYQWLERLANGDSRIDISNLSGSLYTAAKWYIVEGADLVDMSEETSGHFRIIVEHSILGLKKLQGTYDNDVTIIIVLQYMVNLLQDALDDTWDESCYIKISADGSNAMTEKIKNNFDPKIIKHIADMLIDAGTRITGSDMGAIINYIHNILINRDKAFVEIMVHANTTL